MSPAKKEEEVFPFTNDYYDLIKGATLSKRGRWWTALLLVESKTGKDDPNKEPQRKVIVQRWQGFKKKEEGEEEEPTSKSKKAEYTWSRKKDFTISSKKQWEQMREILDQWVEDNSFI